MTTHTNKEKIVMEIRNTSGIGFVGLLTIVFVVLKLCGVINWSWWWVLSPILIKLSLLLFFFCLGILGVFLLVK